MNPQAPHSITDRSKAAKLARAFRRGDSVSPVLTIGDQALTGSHRIFAADLVGAEVDTVEIDDVDYLRACYAMGVETHDDCCWNDFIATLSAVTSDADVRAAAADQIHDGVVGPEAEEAKSMDEEDLRELRGW